MTTDKLTKEQNEAISADARFHIIIAGPGSGKTEVLARRIVRACEEPFCMPSDCTAVTFTNAAGAELARRIESIRSGTRLGYIGTIHGLCLRLLEQHGGRIGYRHGIAVIDDDQARDALKQMAELIGHAKLSMTKLIATRDALGTAARHVQPITPEALVVASYYKRLHASNATDYRGLISEARRLLNYKDVPTGVVRLFVDEGQDISKSDWEVLSRLVPEYGSVTIVGDPDQGIFAFRGGSMQQFLDMIADKETLVSTLEINHRSDRAICDAAQNLIENNSNRFKKRTRPATSGIGIVELLEPAVNESGEAHAIISKIQFMLFKVEAKPSQIAILARTNEIAARLREVAMLHDLPVERVANIEETSGWPFARATVDLLATPRNDLAAEHWITLREGKNVAQQARANAALRQQTIADTYFAGSPPTAGIASLGHVLDKLGVHPASIYRIERICQGMPPAARIADVALAMRAQSQTEERGEGIAVTTMHAAKGREWPIVFLAGMEQETIPGRGMRSDIEEERRLAYVAATRAKHALFLSYANTRNRPFNRMERYKTEPSQFLSEMLRAIPAPLTA